MVSPQLLFTCAYSQTISLNTSLTAIIVDSISVVIFLVTAAGYVVLADFGFAKVVLDKTFTMCGSPEYMGEYLHWSAGMKRVIVI